MRHTGRSGRMHTDSFPHMAEEERKTKKRACRKLCRLTEKMERETGFEPAASSLGS